MERNEISDRRDDIKQDVYRGVRDTAPGGLPGRLASTIHRAADDQPGNSGDSDTIELEHQALNGMKFGGTDGNHSNGK
jgi:hypothetical protein